MSVADRASRAAEAIVQLMGLISAADWQIEIAELLRDELTDVRRGAFKEAAHYASDK
jgi:hypothetical protein